MTKRTLRSSGCLGLAVVAIVSGCRESAQDRSPAKPPDVSADVAVTVPPPSRPAGILPRFRRLGPESGFDFLRFDDISPQRRILEVNGGGVAIFDFDGDGRLDTFMTNGCKLPRQANDRRTPSELYRNAGELKFDRVTATAGLKQFGYAQGGTIGDFDADGFDDLYVTAFGPNTFWRNNGDGTFTDVTEATATSVPQWSSSAAMADLNSDGHLDLYVANYLDESDTSPRLCLNAASPDGYVSCSPALFDGVDDALFLSNGAGGFIDITEPAGLAGMRGKGLGVVIADLNEDRRPEIYVANDGEANVLLVQEPRGEGAIPRFEERGMTSGVALNEAGYAQASMGVAAGDSDGDGTIDLFMTNFYDDTNTLFANRGGLVFEDVTRVSRLGASSRDRLGWGTVFLDADNDGSLDLFVANGHVEDRTRMRYSEPYRMRAQLYHNRGGGTFADVSDWSGEYFGQAWLGRGVAMGDLDRDGRLDLVVSHQLDPSAVLRNETQTSGGVVLQLIGTRCNRDAVGARVEVLGARQPIVRELIGGGSFQSASAQEVHLGLGEADEVDLRVTWSSGDFELFHGIRPGTWIVVEGRGGEPLGLVN